MVLVKGVSRRVIVVDSPDPQVFEQAIFILSGDGAGVSQQQLQKTRIGPQPMLPHIIRMCW